MKVIIDTQVTGIVDLYDAVAKTLGKDPDKCHYDCTKIKCAKNFFNEIEEEYKKLHPHACEGEFGMQWCCYGPKAVDELKSGEVEIEDGFFS